MKKIILFAITLITFAFGCSSENSVSNTSNITSSSNSGNSSKEIADNFKILNWGPEDGKVGSIPNKQPDGKMGIWIKTSPTKDLGEFQVLFGGKPMTTAVSPDGVTAGIPPEEISAAGEKKIEVKMMTTGKVYQVGNFTILP